MLLLGPKHGDGIHIVARRAMFTTRINPAMALFHGRSKVVPPSSVDRVAVDVGPTVVLLRIQAVAAAHRKRDVGLHLAAIWSIRSRDRDMCRVRYVYGAWGALEEVGGRRDRQRRRRTHVLAHTHERGRQKHILKQTIAYIHIHCWEEKTPRKRISARREKGKHFGNNRGPVETMR